MHVRTGDKEPGFCLLPSHVRSHGVGIWRSRHDWEVRSLRRCLCLRCWLYGGGLSQVQSKQIRRLFQRIDALADFSGDYYRYDYHRRCRHLVHVTHSPLYLLAELEGAEA